MVKAFGAALGLAATLLCENALVGAAQRAPACGTGEHRGRDARHRHAPAAARRVGTGDRSASREPGVPGRCRRRCRAAPRGGRPARSTASPRSSSPTSTAITCSACRTSSSRRGSLGRTRPFPVYGPHGLAQMTEHLYAAFSEDIRVRTEGLEHESRDGYRIDVRERSGRVWSTTVAACASLRSWSIMANGAKRTAIDSTFLAEASCCRATRGRVRSSCGWRRESTCSSTRCSHPIRRMRPGNRSASDWASYVRAYHTTALQLGELAARARPKLLVVYHNGRRVPRRSDPRRYPAIIFGSRVHRGRPSALLSRSGVT